MIKSSIFHHFPSFLMIKSSFFYHFPSFSIIFHHFPSFLLVESSFSVADFGGKNPWQPGGSRCILTASTWPWAPIPLRPCSRSWPSAAEGGEVSGWSMTTLNKMMVNDGKLEDLTNKNDGKWWKMMQNDAKLEDLIDLIINNSVMVIICSG